MSHYLLQTSDGLLISANVFQDFSPESAYISDSETGEILDSMNAYDPQKKFAYPSGHLYRLYVVLGGVPMPIANVYAKIGPAGIDSWPLGSKAELLDEIIPPIEETPSSKVDWKQRFDTDLKGVIDELLNL